MSDPAPGPVLCFGEILWDILPQGRFPGGAPINVATHLGRLGLRALPVTAVGRDAPGEELLGRLRELHLETEFVSQVPDKPTGTVQVTLKAGAPTYEIAPEAAWDWIEIPPALLQLAPRAGALVFGSLAQRGQHNRLGLRALRDRCEAAMQVFDVNLRAPYDVADRVHTLAGGADLIKLNDEELARLLAQPSDSEPVEEAARRFAEKTGCSRICVTAGARGAGLLVDGKWLWADARPVQVRDTVGAGDAFLAALLHGLLASQLEPEMILRRACRLAEFVVSRDGATPIYTVEEVPGWTALS